MTEKQGDGISRRLFCSMCNIDIGESRNGKGRQQTMCEKCKKEKKKKHEQAWNFFRYGDPLTIRRRQKSQ